MHLIHRKLRMRGNDWQLQRVNRLFKYTRVRRDNMPALTLSLAPCASYWMVGQQCPYPRERRGIPCAQITDSKCRFYFRHHLQATHSCVSRHRRRQLRRGIILFDRSSGDTKHSLDFTARQKPTEKLQFAYFVKLDARRPPACRTKWSNNALL